jgi:large subunit ribosomal protein L25
MSNIVMTVEKRDKEELKKNSSRRLRNNGFIPAVIYGQAIEPVCIKIDSKKLKEILKGRSITNLILDMKITENGKDAKGNSKEIAIIKEVQKDPIKGNFLHLDFLRIQMEKEVETSVHIVILNEEESIGIKDEGGVVQHGLRELHISCLPMDIPENITYDIKELTMGHSVKVSEFVVKEGIKILNDPEEVVVSIIHPTHLVVEEAPVEEEATATAEPELIAKEKALDKEKEE